MPSTLMAQLTHFSGDVSLFFVTTGMHGTTTLFDRDPAEKSNATQHSRGFTWVTTRVVVFDLGVGTRGKHMILWLS